MNLFLLNTLLLRLGEFKSLLEVFEKEPRSRLKIHICNQAVSFFIASLYSSLRNPVVIVVPRPESAKKMSEQLKMWLSDSSCIQYFPEIEMQNMFITCDNFSSERSSVLSSLTNYIKNNNGSCSPPIVVASAYSLVSRVIPLKRFVSESLNLDKGLRIDPFILLERLQSIGYVRDQIVELPGTFTKRGGIIDVFPVDSAQPLRIEFEGNIIISLRIFDARTQCSLEKLATQRIVPVVGASTQENASLLEYLPENGLLIVDDMDQIKSEIERIDREAKENRALQDIQEHMSEKFAQIIEADEILQRINTVGKILEISKWGEVEVDERVDLHLPLKPAPDYASKFQNFIDDLSYLRNAFKKVVVLSQQIERIKDIIEDLNLNMSYLNQLVEIPQDNSLVLLQGSMDEGFQLENELLLITDKELFGVIKQRRNTKARPVSTQLDIGNIDIGDYVVHIEHGVGKFAGTQKMIAGGVSRDYLVLEYAGNDKLFVPLDQIDRVGPYIGSSDKVPALNRLGTQDWNRTRKRVKQQVMDIARELVKLYAARLECRRKAYSKDTLWQQELEASFPYIETKDQMEALSEIKNDMESVKPMDRLICGDVGYGKTEVALRAAFKAVMDNKQVAILVPTTILAQQHLKTFQERLKTFPVQIAMLSRFYSAKEQQDILQKLAQGSVDICIGTHRLLQKDVVFKELGLVIIDEEQRFGVMHKDYLKKVRESLDVLTLSATPIPRTLHMALSGLRDMSTIETPPENRNPVNTYIGEFKEVLVRNAILREIERDGQVFIVHNRVQSINLLALQIEQIVPEAKIVVAHGQMNEEKLEKVMSEFTAGHYNVLITTTIIESGLDMPNVNTLIIDHADKLGLTQLYQLRGRVGRGDNTAYAYFLFSAWNQLTDQARERLLTISGNTQLGSGFAIAMKDLEIRGAGNLLGFEQSGYITAVGFNYYCQMMAEAIEEIKAEKEGKRVTVLEKNPGVSINLGLSAFISEDYIENMRIKFGIYRRLAEIQDISTVDDIQKELYDRFGSMPQEVTDLLYLIRLKIAAIAAGVETIYSDDTWIVISLRATIDASRRSIIQSRHAAARIGNSQIKIRMLYGDENWKQTLFNLLVELSA